MKRLAAAAVAVAVIGLVGCSSGSSGSDGADKPSTTARSTASTSTTAAGSTPPKADGAPASWDAVAVQKALVAGGIACKGTPKAYDQPTSEPLVGADPELILGCNPGSKSVTMRILQFANPQDRAKAMAAAADLLCSFGMQEVHFVAAGPWAVMAEKDGEPINDLVEKAGTATGVKPTVVTCPTE